VPHPVDRPLDAYGALNFLAARDYVDPARLVVLGFAQGGTTALGLASPNGYTQGVSPHRFAGAIAYTPQCYPGYATVSIPTLILAGEVDSWNPAADCEAMMAGRAGAADRAPRCLSRLRPYRAERASERADVALHGLQRARRSRCVERGGGISGDASARGSTG
jgi:dienelactone hydrolase